MEPNTTFSRNVPPKSSRISKGLVILILILLILVSGFYFLHKKNLLTINKSSSFTSEKVEVVDNNKNVPSGFPESLPIEKENISQSSNINYPEKNVTLYSASYSSQKPPAQIYKDYGDFLKKESYTVSVAKNQASLMNYQASKDGNDLSILITPQPTRTLVQISYLQRQ